MMFGLLFIVLAILMVVDVITTFIGMAYCMGTELNPFYKWLQRFGVVVPTIVGIGVRLFILYALWMSGVIVLIIALIVIYIFIYLKYDNLKVFRCI